MTENTDGLVKVPAEFPEVRILRLQPGDQLLITMQTRLDDQQFDDFMQSMKACFPDHRCVILDAGATLDILRMEGGE